MAEADYSQMPCHDYQRRKCAELRPVVNVGCKEDPAKLGRDFDAVNCDINDYDPQERLSLYEVPNFVRADACALPFDDESFEVAVVGEMLEHCPFDAAVLVLLEACRVIRPSGRIVVTIPLDSRPPEVQHEPHLLTVWEHGITSWHQTVWTDSMFRSLLQKTHLQEIEAHREELEYGFCRGFGAVLVKD